jgi:hypothetical protein
VAVTRTMRSPSCPLDPIHPRSPPGRRTQDRPEEGSAGAAGGPDRPDGRMATRRPEASGDRTARPHGAGSSPPASFSASDPEPPQPPGPYPRLPSERPAGSSCPVHLSRICRAKMGGCTERRRSRFSNCRARFREAKREPPQIGGGIDFILHLADETSGHSHYRIIKIN